MQTGLELPVVVHRALLQHGRLGLRPAFSAASIAYKTLDGPRRPPTGLERGEWPSPRLGLGQYLTFWARKGMADVAHI